MKTDRHTLLTAFLITATMALVITTCRNDNDNEHGHSHDHGKKTHNENKKNESRPGKNHSRETHEKKNRHGHEKQGNGNMHNGRALLRADHDRGIILSEKAITTIGVTMTRAREYAKSKNEFCIPGSALVFYEDRVCLYYKRNKWFKEVNITISKKAGNRSCFTSGKIRKGDGIVTGGADLLRVSYIEAFGASGHGHIH